MLVGHEHLAVRHIGEPVEVEESQQPLGRVLLELEPLVFVQAPGFVDDVHIDPALSQIMEEGPKPKLVELEFCQTQPSDR